MASGIELNDTALEAAVDALDGVIHANEYGPPDYPDDVVLARTAIDAYLSAIPDEQIERAAILSMAREYRPRPSEERAREEWAAMPDHQKAAYIEEVRAIARDLGVMK